MNASSEEKTLPASAKKLRDERRKGHIAKAPDLQAAIVTITLVGWLAADARRISRQLQGLVQTASQAVSLDFPEAGRLMLGAVRETMLRCALVPLLLAVIAAVLAGMITNQGFLFAIDPILPKFEKINPVEGFKNLFRPRNFVELGISLVKAILFGAILSAIAWGTLNDLIRVPDLAPEGLPQVVRALLLPMLGGACVCYGIAGLVDMMVQRAMFLREMRMTQTEAKNERKELLGNPQIKMQRNRLAAENRKNTGKLGPAQATLMICGDNLTVGIRYSPPGTPVPRIICKGTGPKAADYRAFAQGHGIPTRWQHDLAHDLDRAFKPGMTITAAFFPAVAKAIQNK